MTKEQRKKNLKYHEETRRYSFIRIWQKRYAHMKARHEGRATHPSNCQGRGLMSQEEFFAWCKDFANLQHFLTLYFDWAESGFSAWFSPSIDRIDPAKGYVADNIQWLSFADNTEKNNICPITHKRIKRELAGELA